MQIVLKISAEVYIILEITLITIEGNLTRVIGDINQLDRLDDAL